MNTDYAVPSTKYSVQISEVQAASLTPRATLPALCPTHYALRSSLYALHSTL
jgi:hypothetical protein